MTDKIQIKDAESKKTCKFLGDQRSNRNIIQKLFPDINIAIFSFFSGPGMNLFLTWAKKLM